MLKRRVELVPLWTLLLRLRKRRRPLKRLLRLLRLLLFKLLRTRYVFLHEPFASFPFFFFFFESLRVLCLLYLSLAFPSRARQTSREAAKKAKEAAKKNVKKSQKAISALVTSNNYFVPTGTSPSPSVVEGIFADLDVLYGALEPEEVAAVKTEVEGKAKSEEIKSVLVSWAKKVEAKVGEGKFKQFV